MKNNFHVYKNSSTFSINAALWHYLDTYNLDFRGENNNTPLVLIEEIRYVCMHSVVLKPLCCISRILLFCQLIGGLCYELNRNS